MAFNLREDNMQWFGKLFAERPRFMRTNSRAVIRLCFGHSGYLINLGAPPRPIARTRSNLYPEIQLATDLRPFLVLHPAHLGAGEEAGIKML
jgi:endonuclease IV